MSPYGGGTPPPSEPLGPEYTPSAAPSVQSSPTEMSSTPCSVCLVPKKRDRSAKDMVPCPRRPLVPRPAKSKISGRQEVEHSFAAKTLSTLGPMPGPPKPPPEISIQQTQDPIPVQMMPGAYTAARELLNHSVPVSLAMQKVFQLVPITVVPMPALQEHMVLIPILVPGRPVHSQEQAAINVPGTTISRFGLPVSCPHGFCSTIFAGLTHLCQIQNWGLFCPVLARKLTLHQRRVVHGYSSSSNTGHITRDNGMCNHGAHHQHVNGHSGHHGVSLSLLGPLLTCLSSLP